MLSEDFFLTVAEIVLTTKVDFRANPTPFFIVVVFDRKEFVGTGEAFIDFFEVVFNEVVLFRMIKFHKLNHDFQYYK